MAGINWEAMPVWPAKLAASYTGIRRARLVKIAKGDVENLPDDLPKLEYEVDGRKYYFDAESVKAFKAFIDANPGALPTGGKRLPPGVARYRIYLTDEQAQEIASLYPDVRLEKPVRRKKKVEVPEEVAEAAAEVAE